MRISIFALACNLAACSGNHVTQVPDLNRVMTVQEFVADAPLREKVGAFCANNPAQTALDPNCVNVRQAIAITSAGTGAFPRIVPGV